MASGSVSHRLRFGLGVALGAIFAVLLGHLLLAGAYRRAAEAKEARQGIVTLQALTDLIQRTADGDGLRRAVSEFQKGHPEISSIRAVIFDGLMLEASTAASDTGENAAPRRLTREEKPLYDLGQKLRSSVESNREESTNKEELDVRALEGGQGVAFSSPIEKEGTIYGFVEMTRKAAGQAPSPSFLTSASYVLVPVVVFLALAFIIGEKKFPLAAVAAVLLLLTVAGFATQTLTKLNREVKTANEELAKGAKADAARNAALLTDLGLAADPPADPSAWDVDVFRKSRGVLAKDLSADPAKVAAEMRAFKDPVLKAHLLIGLLAFLLMFASGLGWLSAFINTLKENRTAYYYVVPAMVGMVVLVFFPFTYGITLSFTDYNIYNTGKPLTEIFTGFKNYIDILTDFKVFRTGEDGSWVFNYLNFYWTLFFTIVWTVSNVTIGVTCGLVLALALNTKTLALKPVYRVLLVLPWAVPNYITALIWRGMFHQQFGVINQVIQMFGGQPVSWFNTPFTSFITALATNGWLSFPFMMVISLGALQSIPADLYEAARVDGATRWQQFTSITLPSLKPALVPAIILSVVWTFNMFNIVYLVTAGEPAGSTEILITQAYKFAFEKYRYGYAAAYSTIIFGILLVYGVFQNRVTKATEGI